MRILLNMIDNFQKMYRALDFSGWALENYFIENYFITNIENYSYDLIWEIRTPREIVRLRCFPIGHFKDK